ncbi:hypothetical protein KA013_03345 [Patescibacteria group bacterium]|nr:hypothetical protein [Patescibacteria group bacterium]
MEEFTIMATSSSFGDAVKYVRVYDEDGKLVATKNPGEDTATFIGTNLILNKGSNTFYITLEPYAVGESIQAPQTATFTLKWRTDEAVGVTSNNTISVGTVHNTEDIITIAPIGIESIELLDSYEGYHVDEQLFNNVEADLAIVKITFAEGFSFDTSSSEDLEAVLQTLTARLEDGTDG